MLSVPLLTLKSTSVSAGFLFVSPGYTIQPALCYVLPSWFQPDNLVTTSHRTGFQPSLPLLALGSVYVGQGNTKQFLGSLAFFQDSFVSSWLIVWAD